MPHIFTPEEILKLNIPTKEDYSRAFSIARQELEALVRKDIVVGSLFYGSSVHNDRVIGSDIDVFVVTEWDEDREKGRQIRELEIRIKNLTGIDLNAKPLINTAQLDLGLMRYLDVDDSNFPIADFAFFDYLFTCNKEKNVVGENPLELLMSFDMKPQTREGRASEIRERFRLYKETLDAKINEDNYFHLLGKIIRHPFFTALDIFWVKTGEIPVDEDGRFVGKRKVCELYKREFPYVDSKGLFSILEQFEGYKEFLDCCERKVIPLGIKQRQLPLFSDTSPFYSSMHQIGGRYKSILRAIENNLENARNFIGQNVKVLSSLSRF